MIKVLHIVTAFPRSDAEDSMTPWLIATLQQLERIGIKNTIFAPSYKGLGNQTVMGLDVRRFRYFPRCCEDLTHDVTTPAKLSQKPWYVFWVPFLLFFGRRAFSKLIRAEQFDIVHIHWPLPMAFIGAPAFGKVPNLLHFYTAETAMARRYPIAKKFLRWAMKRTDEIIAISTHAMNLAKEAFDRPIKIVPYGSFFPEKPPEVFSPKADAKKKILFVGRIVERKGVQYLIQAMPGILKKIDAELIIVGGGAPVPQLKTLAHELGIEKNVLFTGIIKAKDKDRYYRESDVFVLPACYDKYGDTEGLGVVLLEALSVGKPVVASAVGGIVDIVINEKTGLLVPEKDPQALADALVRILTDDHLYIRLAKDGYQYALKNFSVSAVAENIKTIYEALLMKSK